MENPEQQIPAEETKIKGKRGKKKVKKSIGREILEWIFTIVAALLIASLIRFFIVEPVRVDGHSMDDTLADGEIMLVSKFDYSTTWLTWPFGTCSDEEAKNCGKITFGGNPSRFDVVICHYPDRQNINFVKRVIGLPGDTVEIAGGYVYVNGEKYDEPYVSDNYRNNSGSAGGTFEKHLVPKKGDVVAMKDGVLTFNGQPVDPDVTIYGTTGDYRRIRIDGGILYEIVPENATKGARLVMVNVTEDTEIVFDQDNYLVMGDHRNNSNDSRMQGAITRDMIVGHVRQVLYPFSVWRTVLNGLDY